MTDSQFIHENKYHGALPPQQLPMSKKGKEWRKAHLDWANLRTFFNYSPVRKSAIHKKINYDLFNGKTHLEDMMLLLNPEHIDEKITPSEIPHYPIIDSKLRVLIGELSSRVFDFRVVVTNPTAISEKEEEKKNQILQELQAIILQNSQDELLYNQQLLKMSDFFMYDWQDMREIRANQILNHYIKEYNMPQMFIDGFHDALIVGEEMYQCDIRGGEPVIERLNPLKVLIWKSGFSNKIEDADIITIEDYWSPGKIIDTYYDVLTKKDIEYIENAPNFTGSSAVNEMGERDERFGFINNYMIDDTIGSRDSFYFDPFNAWSGVANNLLPFDMQGNIRVLRVYWKSRRKIKKVKYYDQITGEELYDFYDEYYQIDETKGEEETIYYINEAWEGTLIGEEIYVNMRPRVVLYNRLSNPSRCHFGIVGSIYNINESKPYSMVDMMKPYSYLYDIIHDRLNKLMSRNWGKIVMLDFAKMPKGWEMDKWMYFAKHNGIAVSDSWNEGQRGAALGKTAASISTPAVGVIDAELGNSIQQYINQLEFIKLEMSEVVGITRQREGQIANRETVGGVERSTLQSSHITEWWFGVHDDVKKRALECFLETAKIAFRGKSEKFQYILSDGSLKIMDIDGDEFADADYGLVVDNSKGSQELNQKIEALAQAGLQNQLLSFSAMMKLFGSASLQEKIKMIEKQEQEMQQRLQEAQQQQQQMQELQLLMQAQMKEAEMQQQDQLNARDNETKIMVAQINAQAKLDADAQSHMWDDGIQEPVYSQEAKDKLAEQIRQFDEKMKLEREKLDLNKQIANKTHTLNKEKMNKDYEIKKRLLSQRNTSNNK